MGIPVANIYFLLCYAWDEFAPRQMDRVAIEEAPDTLHLFAQLLDTGVCALRRRGLDTGYIGFEEQTSTVRGRILFGETVRLITTKPKKVLCSFDQMTPNILTNQILKTTIVRLLGEMSLKSEIRRSLRRTLSLLHGIDEIELNTRLFHHVNLHQNNHLYSFLMNVCRFFHESMEAQEGSGHYRFRDVDRDEERMRSVFEKFVRNFYDLRQRVFKVKSERMQWKAAPLNESDPKFLPELRTDATLRSAHKTIIIECKYTEKLYNSRRFSNDVYKLRSDHLYQLCTYLRNLQNDPGQDGTAEGILLYPTAEEKFDQSYLLQGHRVRIRTVDLNQAWRKIEQDLLSLLQPLEKA